MTRSPVVELALVLAGVTAFVALAFAYWPYTVDDTFIFLRYAQNLINGHGLTWNPGGPPVEGYTSFSWTVLLAAPFVLHVDPLLFAKFGGVLCMLGAAVAASRLAWRLADSRLAAALTAFLVLLHPPTSIHAVSGMETSFATLLFAWWSLESLKLLDGVGHRWRWALLGLALGLTRPEANLVVGVGMVLIIARASQRRELIIAAALGHVLPGALYFVTRALWYGHLLPLPFYVKALGAEASGLAGWPESFEFFRLFTWERPWIFVPFVAALIRLPKSRWVLAPVAAWWLFFLYPQHQMGFDLRYLYPLMPVMFAVTAAGLIVIARSLPEQLRIAAPVLTVLLGVWLTFFNWLVPSLAEKHEYGLGVSRAHEPIGRWLADQQTSRPVVAALDVGAIAFHSGWTVIDTWGLNDPQFALSAAKGRSYQDVLARDPSVIIVISGQREKFEPLFDYEGPLYGEALRRGFIVHEEYEFTPTYFLWLLINPSAFRP